MGITFTLDISEVNQWLGCKRQWWLNSGNVNAWEIGDTSKALQQGTVFHEALALLYKNRGGDMEPYYKYVRKHGLQPIDWMIQEYIDGPLILDLSIFEILDVEWKFGYPMRLMFGHMAPDGVFRGAVDVVVRHKKTGEIWGIEHKTATRPRIDAAAMQHDLQCLTYMQALQLRYGEVAGIIVSEILKDTRRGFLQHQRILVRPSVMDISAYKKEMLEYTNLIYADKNKKNPDGLGPVPGARSKDFLTCNWCSFHEICKDILLDTEITDEVWAKWEPQIRVRDVHHLEQEALV